ncbi:hypothetical protein AB0E69_25970 [Kribbella sp. NPDC026611]|uniref:hypothetical protein n=1 Tax=Kribbella sp. NPDC026611 TaxID=3154911 RepID=UPI0033FC6AAA
MTDLLDRRPDRPLPPETHEKLRAELLAAIETEPVRSPRRYLIPAVAAVAVFALVVGLRAWKPDAKPPVTGPVHPTVRILTAAETETLHQQCLAESDKITANGLKRPFHDFTVVRAFEFNGVDDPNVVTTWLIGDGVENSRTKKLAHLPDDVVSINWFCSRTKGGKISESSLRMGKQAIFIGGRIHLMARNAGAFVAPITRVTVQPPGQAEVEAYLMGSFWFAPTEGRLNWGPYDADDPLKSKYVVRGYDAAGKVIDLSPDPSAPPTVTTCPMVTMRNGDGSWTSVPRTSTPPRCRQYPWKARLD